MPETPEHIEPNRRIEESLLHKRRLQMEQTDFSLDTRLARTSGIREPKEQAKRVKLTKFELLLKFLKPITWIPVIWSFVCGAVASGVFSWSNLADWKFWLGILLTGPLATGVCQMLNDYFDRDLDAINEPTRPIPAGDISLRDATILITAWTVLTVGVAWLLHPFIVAHVILGIINAHLYSANPIKLKKRLWWGNIIVAFSYLVYPWLSGEVLYRGSISAESVIISLCYAFASTGTMTVNDFKSIEGDQRVGIFTLPVVYGEHTAAVIAAVLIDTGQLLAAAYMFALGKWVNGLLILLFIVPQVWLQYHFVQSPRTRDVWYNGIAQNFLVAGMLVCALAVEP
ncbi:MAG: chlorophyll synthase ChlG [Chloroherpetonaceae bacterium]|nr:chlorophyll synthase ChlG [Chloroherpetonaceae bacterium]MDW8019746.1 chlorophyll synthase ChlG [Chloroherpetonaceae bacterium]